MAATLLGGAAVGAVFGELLKAVLEVADKTVAFKQTLINLRSTLLKIAPVINQIEQHNNELGHPQEELESLIRHMEEGTRLVCECSKINRLNYLARARRQRQLEALVNSIFRFFIIDMTAQTARDQKETLIKVRKILSTVNKLPLVNTNLDSTVPVLAGDKSDSERTQLDEENAAETDSIGDQMSQLTRIFSMSSISMSDSDNNLSSTSLAHSISVPMQDIVYEILRAQYKGSLRDLLLHGNLDIWVRGAKKMRNKIEGPYVLIYLSNAIIGRASVITNSEKPMWEQHFYVPVAHHAAEVHFVVKDSDVVSSQLIGIGAIPVEQIYSGEKVQVTYPVLNNYGRPCKSGAVLSVSIQYIPMEKLSFHHQGVDYIGVPGTYFPLRKGGTVTLYQDAHVPDGFLPNVILDNGIYYDGKCWLDIFEAIRQAQHLIYITGRLVWHNLRLVRDAGYTPNFTLGALLKYKAQEGVRVLLLVPGNPTSRSSLGYNIGGVMETHDEETRELFGQSFVHVPPCPPIAGKEFGPLFTHNQKTVIVDADAGNNKRKIIAFVGGLDLCDGGYDTPHHPLFRTVQMLHKDDYHNPAFRGDVGGCPMEPWHDLHSKIDGPAAYDVLTNFEECWSGAAKFNVTERALLKLDLIPNIISATDACSVGDDDPEAWHVQIFRSIDSKSVNGFPEEPKDAPSKNLLYGKSLLIDMSIHTSYVRAIRAAQHYIYIENQYFIGSSYNWSQYKDLGANNLIPMEIALKIAEKISANERFAVYIVIPMWPEGAPTEEATQRILFWQHKTMQMMYETIFEALAEAGLEEAYTPQDYLNFFCLGNREAIDIYEKIAVSGTPPQANSPQANSRNNRRFMIHVHSKGMIVDDEYVILGSANINQRSMEGTRDTEIAMGAYQPHHTWAKKQSYPHGQIHGYRMSLWAEHMGTIEDCFLQPESLECVRRVRTMGELHWKQFSANDVTEMRGHLLNYPVKVDRTGKVRTLPGHEEFPDVGGKIIGSLKTELHKDYNI